MKKALIYGIAASFFFAFTFLLNHSMNLSGGYWMWSACLRYFFMLPMLAVLLLPRGNRGIMPVISAIKDNCGKWILWSTVGFGLFYLPLCMASLFGESWMVAASWQLTIVAGVLLTPLFGKKIPVKNIATSIIILVGIALLQAQNLTGNDWRGNLISLIPILIAAFAYPLGNRKMMEVSPSELDTIQRVFGMTLCSIPFWIVTAVIAAATGGAPSGGQILQCALVALFSGVVATTLFFHATDMVKDRPKQLALVEATQCGEVVFTLIGGIFVLGDSVPGVWGFIGLALIVAGMVAGSLVSA